MVNRRRRLLWLLLLIPLLLGTAALYLLLPRPRPTVAGESLSGSMNILVIGRDARAVGPVRNEGLVRQQRETTSHSDIMVIFHLNFDRGRLNLVALPRDLLAEVPGVTAADSALDFNNMEKLTHVHAIGGEKLLRRTVEHLLGITIHQSVAFDFDSFRMTFGLLEPFIGRLRVSGITLADRQQALMFARRRQGLKDDDIDRCRNCVLFIRAVLNRTWWLADTRLGSLTLRRVLGIIGPDTDLSRAELEAIISSLNRSGFRPELVRTAVLVGEGAMVTLNRYRATLSCYLPAYGEIRRQVARYLLDQDSVKTIGFMTREQYRAPGYLFGNYVLDTLQAPAADSAAEATRLREMERWAVPARPESCP